MQVDLFNKYNPAIAYVMTLAVTQFYSYMPWSGNSWWNTFYFFVFSIFLLVFFRNRRKLTSHPFANSVNLLIIALIMSVIPAYIDFNQSIVDSGKAIIILGVGYMFYYYLHNTRITEDQLSKCITIIVVVYTLIEFVQFLGIIDPMFSYWSGKINEGGEFHERFGIVRYQVRGICFLMFALSLTADKVFNGNSKRIFYISLLLFVAAGIYLYGARKLYYMVVVIIAMSAIFSEKSHRKLNIMLLIISLVYIISNFYADFSQESSNLTEAQSTSSGDFIRLVSAEYFISSFSDSVLYPLFGSGIAWGGSPLHQELLKLADIGVYQADSGIIGYYSKTGLLGLISVLSIYYYLYKYWVLIDKKYKIYLLSSLVIVFFDFWAIIPEGVLCMCLCLYMCDINIKKNYYTR